MNRLIGLVTSAIVGLAASTGAELDSATVSWLLIAVYSGVHQVAERVRGK